jgi:hypothetical protein
MKSFLIALACCAIALSAAAQPAPPARVTSDSTEYCSHLQERVDGMTRDSKSPPPAEVHSLTQEGHRLCEDGQTRSGILHLRRAFILMHEPEPKR